MAEASVDTAGRSNMHLDRRFLNWGVFLILLGLVPLSTRQGWIDSGTLGGAWRLWPLILVGIGVGIVLRRTPAGFLGGLIVAATCGLLVGALLAGGRGDFGFACGSGQATSSFPSRSGTLDPSASVSLEVSCADATVGTAAGSGWTVAGFSADSQGPTVNASGSRLEIRQADGNWAAPFGPAGSRDAWAVTLPTGSRLSLGLTLNAGTAHLNLAQAQLASLTMTTNAGSQNVDLSGATVDSLTSTVNAGSTTINLPGSGLRGSLTVNAGSLSFCVPSGTAIRVTTGNTVLGSNNFSTRGLTQSGEVWTTPGYDTATSRIDLSANVNLGSIDLNPEGGCK